MDSINDYIKNSKSGGPAGEIRIRHALEGALSRLDVVVDVAGSDAEFWRYAAKADAYDAFILDPWTWAGKGWKPRPFIVGQEPKVFILDFFGRPKFPSDELRLDPKHILTAFPTSPANQFLGYSMAPPAPRPKLAQGVLWGKMGRYFQGAGGKEKLRLLEAVAAEAPLVSTLSPGQAPLKHDNMKYVGHLTPEGWQELLATSRFMIGLGDPLLGPSALDAVSNGCVYIDTVYRQPKEMNADAGHRTPGVVYKSQHPYLGEQVGPPYVCTAREGVAEDYLACVRAALAGPPLAPYVPPPFTPESYQDRVAEIFRGVLA